MTAYRWVGTLLVGFWLFGASAYGASTEPCCDDCVPNVGTMLGVEDFELDTTTTAGPRLILSADARPAEGDGSPTGGLYQAAVNAGGITQPTLLIDRVDGVPLRPHGISLLPQGTTSLLFVINHSQQRDALIPKCRRASHDETTLRNQILVFRLRADAIELIDCLADPKLRNPNDVAAVSATDVFVTNTPGRSLMRGFLEWSHLHISSDVVHFDGTAWRTVAARVRYPNGILATTDRVYVASSMSERLHVFARAGNDLRELRERALDIPAALDNLLWAVDDDGRRIGADMYVTGHADPCAFLKHTKDHAVPSPSDVYLVHPDRDPPTFHRVHRNDGRSIMAASVGLVFRRHLYLGQVFAAGVGVCECTRCASVE